MTQVQIYDSLIKALNRAEQAVNSLPKESSSEHRLSVQGVVIHLEGLRDRLLNAE